MIKMPNRKFFSLFFLILFVSVKGLNYHPMAHSSEEDLLKCELCEVVILHDTTPVIFTAAYDFETVDFELETAQVQKAEISTVSSFFGDFYCRPPPSLA